MMIRLLLICICMFCSRLALAEQCPKGQAVTIYTQGQCCWPGQGWHVKRRKCVGRPSKCPLGTQIEGDDCIDPSCPKGKEKVFQGQCCWPGQVWAGACVGTPECPKKMFVSGTDCVLPSKLGIAVVSISAGTFTMGSKEVVDAKPAFQVQIDRSFYIMQSEVTQGLYQKIMGHNPAKFAECGVSCPVEQVSWYDAILFANALSRREGLQECYVVKDAQVKWPSGFSCNGWRLPTEAEWEYAARGKQRYQFAGSNQLHKVGWYAENSSEKTHPVCQKRKNKYRLCDMSGNVWEWVWDWKGPYTTVAKRNPVGPSKGTGRVGRGGSWRNTLEQSQVLQRHGSSPRFRFGNLGFRLVRNVVK